MSFVKDKRILVTGGSGFLGRRVCQALHVCSPAEIRVPRSSQYDLRQQADVRRLLQESQPHVVIHLAAVVGGIGANRANPGRFFYDNATMAIHLMEASRLARVEKFVSIGTICSYPKNTPVPFKEDDLWNGYPEETNAPYGLAKKMLLVQGQAYRQQYGLNAITLLPVNLYGPGDNFDPQSSHVIPALIRKTLQARDGGERYISVWGTGNASREFLYVDDAARAIVLATDSYNEPEPVNIGSGQEIRIHELVRLICELCDFDGEIRWDTTKPDGQPRRCLDTSRAKEAFGFTATTALSDGLRETIAWYEKNREATSDRRERTAMSRESSIESRERTVEQGTKCDAQGAKGGERTATSSSTPITARATLAHSGNGKSGKSPNPWQDPQTAIRNPPDSLGFSNSQSSTHESKPRRRAFITGITGQDGSYLAELLLNKGYEVHGIVRRSSSIEGSWRLNDIYQDPQESHRRLFLHYGDLTDANSLSGLIFDIEPDEIYHLGAQSHVRVSFDNPLYTVNVGALGTVSILEAARQVNRRKEVRFYQASSSEMFGGQPETAPQSEATPFHPRSPYACSKAFAFHQTVNYREAYDLFACNGILFNHESPRRGETFVTRKITRAASRIREGIQDKLYLGNLDAQRDWGYAKDYVEAMWLMLQHDEPDDFVIAMGQTNSVREFLELAFDHVDRDWRDHVEIDPRYFRPSEVDVLCGDATKARDLLGWQPTTSFEQLVAIMVDADWDAAKHELAVQHTLKQQNW